MAERKIVKALIVGFRGHSAGGGITIAELLFELTSKEAAVEEYLKAAPESVEYADGNLGVIRLEAGQQTIRSDFDEFYLAAGLEMEKLEPTFRNFLGTLRQLPGAKYLT